MIHVPLLDASIAMASQCVACSDIAYHRYIAALEKLTRCGLEVASGAKVERLLKARLDRDSAWLAKLNQRVMPICKPVWH